MSELSEQQLEQRQQAARKHGIRAFEERGPEALAPAQIGRLQELKQMVRSQPGREELRAETTARVALIVELAFNEMRETAEEGESIFEAGVTARAATWFAELRRLLDAWPPDEMESAADSIRKALDADD